MLSVKSWKIFTQILPDVLTGFSLFDSLSLPRAMMLKATPPKAEGARK
jgi:hypothetical protein